MYLKLDHDISKHNHDDKLDSLVVVRPLAAGATIVVEGPLAAVAPDAGGISSSIKTSVISVAEAIRLLTDQ